MNNYVSDAVVRRLPRYRRYLKKLKDQGIQRISSKDLGNIMDVVNERRSCRILIRDRLPEALQNMGRAALKAFGELRGTNEKQRLFKITPTGNGNTGIIADGGVQIPYVLTPELADGDLVYGNPLHYLLGLFGDYEIRIDESVKAIERMHTILGDVALGGNVIEHEGFVYFSSTVSAG